MPRCCVLCGHSQSSTFAVFTFPSSIEQRTSWIETIRTVKENFASDQVWQKRKLKNGVCQLHFQPDDIKNGPKTRLRTGAVPSLNIKSLTNKYDSVVMNYKKILDQGVLCDENRDDLITCSINKMEYDISTVTEISTVFQKNCAICGKEGFLVDLLSLNSIEMPRTNDSMSKFLSGIIKSDGKANLSNSFICSECEQNVKVIEDIKHKLDERIRLLISSYNATKQKMNLDTGYRDSFKVDCDDEIESSLTENERIDCKNKDYSCLECSGVFSDLVNLLRHQCNETINSTKGKTCFMSGTNKGYRYLQSQKIKCTKCNKSFASKQMYLKHLEIHKRNFDCPVCGRYITTKPRLKFHMYKFHGIGQPKKLVHHCAYCSKSFTSKPGLVYHEQVFHRSGPKLKCKPCNKIFYSPILYKSHKLYAHGKKSVVCEQCGELFFTVSKLNCHINAIHRQAKSWSCKKCMEKFTTPGAFQQHTLLKHKNMGYPCSFCNSQFKKKSLFVRHLWKHGLYFCLFCGVKKEKNKILASHILEKHKRDFSNELGLDGKNVELSSNGLNSNNAPVYPEVIINEGAGPVVLNDILITDFENDNLNAFSCNINKDKQSYADETNIKLKSFTMLPPSQELSGVDSFPFSNVDGLEVSQTADDVSLLNVQMLNEIDMTHTDSLKDLRLCGNENNSHIISSTMEDSSNSENIHLHSIESEKRLSEPLASEDLPKITLSLENPDSLSHSLVETVNENFNSGSLESRFISPQFSSTQIYEIPTSDQISRNDWAHNDSLPTSNELDKISEEIIVNSNCENVSSHQNNMVDALVPVIPDSMIPTVVSIEDISSSHADDDVSQVTEEISIHLGINDESKLDVLDAAIDNVKLTHHEIPTLSLEIGDLKENPGYKYVMYIDADIEKK